MTAPVLFVSGGRAGYHPPDEDARVAAFPDVRTATLEAAGHMMHWTMPIELVRVLTGFFGAP